MYIGAERQYTILSFSFVGELCSSNEIPSIVLILFLSIAVCMSTGFSIRNWRSWLIFFLCAECGITSAYNVDSAQRIFATNDTMVSVCRAWEYLNRVLRQRAIKWIPKASQNTKNNSPSSMCLFGDNFISKQIISSVFFLLSFLHFIFWIRNCVRHSNDRVYVIVVIVSRLYFRWKFIWSTGPMLMLHHCRGRMKSNCWDANWKIRNAIKFCIVCDGFSFQLQGERIHRANIKVFRAATTSRTWRISWLIIDTGRHAGQCIWYKTSTVSDSASNAIVRRLLWWVKAVAFGSSPSYLNEQLAITKTVAIDCCCLCPMLIIQSECFKNVIVVLLWDWLR